MPDPNKYCASSPLVRSHLVHENNVWYYLDAEALKVPYFPEIFYGDIGYVILPVGIWTSTDSHLQHRIKMGVVTPEWCEEVVRLTQAREVLES